MHCIAYYRPVTGLYAVTMVPGWLYQAQRTLSAKAQLVSAVETPLMPEGQMSKVRHLRSARGRLVSDRSHPPVHLGTIGFEL